jgi:hypothetical protein
METNPVREIERIESGKSKRNPRALEADERRRWCGTFVEEYDATYDEPFRDWERNARESLLQGRRHIADAEMKGDRVAPGHPQHRLAPEE